MDRERIHVDDPLIAIAIRPFSTFECRRRRTCLYRAWGTYHSRPRYSRSHHSSLFRSRRHKSIPSSIYRWTMCRTRNRPGSINGMQPHQTLPVHSSLRICRHDRSSDRIGQSQRMAKIRKSRTWKDRTFSMVDQRTFTCCPIWIITPPTVRRIRTTRIHTKLQTLTKRQTLINHQIHIKRQTLINHHLHSHHNIMATHPTRLPSPNIINRLRQKTILPLSAFGSTWANARREINILKCVRMEFEWRPPSMGHVWI